MLGYRIEMEGINEKKPRQYRVHRILAHSYTVYLILFLIGVYLDAVFKFEIFSDSAMVPTGIILLILSSILILWAHKSSRNFEINNLSKESFLKGPYRYTRHPTHWGLFFLMLGFAIIWNGLFVILSTLTSFLLTRHIFLEKHEKVMEEKYGTSYIEYEKAVRL